MDNRKIGKLIASLRKQQGLTQQELGDKVGVGFRAVSKWERGLTLPDITIINEVSKILGITSDELLAGEIDKSKEVKAKKKISIKIKTIMLISIISTLALVISALIIFYHKNQNKIYNITSIDDRIQIEGIVSFKKDDVSIIISKLRFKNKEFSSLLIEDYEYEIYIGKEFIYGYGYSPNAITLEKIEKVNDFAEKFYVNYRGKTNFNIDYIIKNKIKIKINFIDLEGKIITNEYEADIFPSKKDIA